MNGILYGLFTQVVIMVVDDDQMKHIDVSVGLVRVRSSFTSSRSYSIEKLSDHISCHTIAKKKNTIHYLSRWRAYIIRVFDDDSICLDVMVDLSRLIRHRFMIDEVERRTSRALEILGNKVECVSNDS